MENPSGLECFLRDLRSSGQFDGEGQFKLAKDEALRKLAGFQIPFQGAWVIKVIQSLLASQVRTPITVSQTRRVTTVRCQGQLPWTLPELEEAFGNPNPHSVSALAHMAMALRWVGLGEKRGFELRLAGGGEALIWDGACLHNLERQAREETVLTVTHDSPLASSGWLEGQIQSARRNADVALALRDRCFTCPVHLTLDGQRIDGLHHCPRHGWSKHSFPLSLAFLQGDLPNQAWPPGTSEALSTVESRWLDLEASGALVRGAVTVEASALAVMMSAHVQPGFEQGEMDWQLQPVSSDCHWIQDGACVHVEQVSDPCGVSVALFLSANGLATDLSGFQLRESPEKSRRLKTAIRLGLQPINALTKIPARSVSSHLHGYYQKLSSGLLFLGLGLGWTLGWTIAPPTLVAMGLAGFLSCFAKESKADVARAKLNIALYRLEGSWGKPSTRD